MRKSVRQWMDNALPRLTVRLYALINRTGFFEHHWGRALFDRFYYRYKAAVEDPFARLVRDQPHLFEGGHILDIGANIGYTSSVFAAALSPGYHVYSFEPEGRNFEHLSKIVARSGFRERIMPVHAAVGERSGSVLLSINQTDPSDHRVVTGSAEPADPAATERVDLVSVDDFVARQEPPFRVAFVKIDVQGYEEPVLHGLARLADSEPDLTVALEYCPSAIRSLGFDPAAIPAFFRERRYAMYLLSRSRGLEAIAADRLDQTAARRGYVDLLFARRSLR